MPATARLISTHDTAERRKSTTAALPDVPMIRSMEELLAALRARRDELQRTNATIDGIAGWPDFYAAKLFCEPPIKNLGWQSLGLALGSLGIALIPVLDEEQIKRVESRWIKRERPIQRTGKHHPQPGNKSNCNPSLNVENTESIKIAAPQSQPAPVSRSHLRVVQVKRVRRYG
jgi:hypothetical protein